MGRNRESAWPERAVFLLLGALLLMVTAAWRPPVYGNSEASIKQYIYRTAGERLGDHVELLAMEDVGPDRVVVFRRETKRPDDVWVVRFQKDAAGNYGDYYGCIRPMQNGGRGVYTGHLSGLGGDGQAAYFAAWSETPELAAVWARFGTQPEQRIPVMETPSLLVMEWPEGVRSCEYYFYDAQGKEL